MVIDVTTNGSVGHADDDGSRAEVDIVAVHGLYEDAYDTWTEPLHGTHWLRDLFPHQKYHARMLAYSYPAQKLMPDETHSVQLLSHATNLVVELHADREFDKGVERPIIFVCHGFGGLLVKSALVYSNKSASKETEHLRSIYVSTWAILFFGTPHNGVDPDFLLSFHGSNPRGQTQQLLRALRSNSDFLNDITDHFAPLRKRFRVHYFSEGLRTTVGDSKTWVVPPSSAVPVMDEVPGCTIFDTHSGMVKFKDRNSQGCNVVLAALESFWPKGASEIRIRWDDERKQRLEERQRRAREELGVDQQGLYRRFTVDDRIEDREYHVPHAPSSLFIGRQRYAQEAKERLGSMSSAGKPKVLVLFGLGGSGKTRLALKFAEDSRDRYWGIFWADSTSYETLETSFASLSMVAGKGSYWLSAIHWLSQCSKPWLLVFDNADDPDMDLSKYIPQQGKGHIMITTRNPEASVYATEGCIKLSGMDPEEAIELLLQSAYPEPDTKSRDPEKKKDAGAIAKRLGYLAIALTHAGAAIRKNIYTLEAYLHHYLGHRRIIMKSASPHTMEYADTITTWELPFQKISRKESVGHRDAVDLVHLFAFLHFESIPEQIFRRSWHNLLVGHSDPETYPDFVHIPYDEDARARFRGALRVLYDYSLIEHDLARETCSLHPVVHRWAQERLSPTQQLRWLKCTMKILAYCISPHLEASGRQFRRSLLPHIGACLRGLKDRGINLPDTLITAGECEKFALVYAENGRWDVARRWQERVLMLRKKELGWWHQGTILVEKSLAETEWNLFDIRSAALRQKHILMLRWFMRPSLSAWAAWPPWNVDYIDYCLSLDDLSRTLWLAGNRTWSRHVGERAVRGLTKRLGPDDPQTLNAAFNLARTYLHLGEQQLSRKLLVTVLLKRKRFFGMDHPDTLMTRNELGMNLCAQKTPDQTLRQRQLVLAETLVRNVHKTRERILGEEHAYTLWSVNDLSKVLCERQRGAEAVKILEDILGTVERTLGERHAGMIMTKSNLARAYVLCQCWEKAEGLLCELLKVISPDHPDLINARSGLVHVRIRMGKVAEAETDCNRLLNMMKEKRFEKILAPDSPRALKIYEQMLEIYHLQGRTAELKALSIRVPAAKVPSEEDRFDMLPTRKILRTESELGRLGKIT